MSRALTIFSENSTFAANMQNPSLLYLASKVQVNRFLLGDADLDLAAPVRATTCPIQAGQERFPVKGQNTFLPCYAIAQVSRLKWRNPTYPRPPRK